MKQKLYTRSYDLALLKDLGNEEAIFTAEEHARMTEQHYKEFFESKEALLRWYLPLNAEKLNALGFLIKHITQMGFMNVLSMGAGQCVLEYLLKCGLPEKSYVAAADFDLYFVNKAKHFFPNIIPVNYDFSKDNVGYLQYSLGVRFDIAIFLGSAYVMHDDQFIGLFGELKKIGVRQIIDFHAGYMDWREICKCLLRPLKKSRVLKKLLGKPPMLEENYQGKFHGYGRSRMELRKLYRKAGIKLIKEFAVEPYKYVAICNCGTEKLSFPRNGW